MPENTTYYVVGTINDWTESSTYALTQDAEDTNKFKLSEVSLSKDAKIKVKLGGTDVYYSSVSTYRDCGYYLDYPDGNVCISASGTYNIYFYLSAQNGNHIVLEEVEPPVPTTVLLSSFNNINVVDHEDYVTISFGTVSYDIEKDTSN